MTALKWVFGMIVYAVGILMIAQLAEQVGIDRWGESGDMPRGYLMTGDK
jgi:hypothetical protein